MIKIFPSLLAADFGRLAAEIKALEAAGADGFHLDIMDLDFAPNLGLGLGDALAARRATKKTLSAHLMVKSPLRYVAAIAEFADEIFVHAESDNAAGALRAARRAGVRAGLALKPRTIIRARAGEIAELFRLAESLLVLRVEPGFSGQAAVKGVDGRIEKLCALGLPVAVDGAVDRAAVARLAPLGVKRFAAGAAVFKAPRGYATAIKSLKTAGGP